ncbi:MAG: histidine kinase dimerization/phospho-acceptor domain-containing protein, partial [Fidelibacterota bacterium]
MKKALERLFPNLASKVLVAVVVALFVTAATIVFLAHQTGYKMLEKQIWAKAHVAADFGKAILEHVMLEGDVDQLQSALEMAITAHQVDDVLILKSDGTVPLSVNNKYRFQKFPLEQFREIPGADDNRYMSVWENGSRYEYIVSPIIKKPECYRCHKESEPVQGYLAVKIRMDDLRVISSEHRTRNIVMTLLVFCGLGGVIFLALVILVTKPIGQLHSHMRRIEEEIGKLERGEASHYPLLKVPERNDEIADLGRTFNNLLSRLNDATAKLRDMHERQLEQADRLVTVGEMAASLAHEIKNPLAGILGALQVIDGETPENDPRREVISQMLGQLDRMNRTVDDLLSYARPSSPVIKEVEINGLIEGIIPFLQRQVKGKEI